MAKVAVLAAPCLATIGSPVALAVFDHTYVCFAGNANLVNTAGREGAVGFVSPLLARLYPVRLVRLKDAHSAGGEIVRGKDGRAVLCAPYAA